MEFLSSPVAFFSCVEFVVSTARTPNVMPPDSPDDSEAAAWPQSSRRSCLPAFFLPAHRLHDGGGGARGERMLLFTPDSIPAAEPFGLYATQRLPSVSRLLRRPSYPCQPGARPDTTHCLRPQAFRGSLARTHQSIDRSLAGHQAHWRRLSPGLFTGQRRLLVGYFLPSSGCGTSQGHRCGSRTGDCFLLACLHLYLPVHRRRPLRHDARLQVTPQRDQ